MPGVCSVCGKRIYREEALTVKGEMFCFAGECRPEILTVPPKPLDGQATPESTDRSIRRLIVHSSFTIALCAVVLTVWVLREVSKLRDENRLLRTSRLALIEQLKNSNRELRTLTDTLSHPPPAQPSPVNHLPQPGRSGIPRASYPPSTTIPHHFINGPSDRKLVSLTFDGGSLANISGAVLDTLGSRSIRATMFLTGEFIRKFPEVTRRIVAEGHECGNHTFGHPHLTTYPVDHTRSTLPGIDAQRLEEQLSRAEDLFRRTTGVPFAPLWRAPYGEFNRDLCRWGYEAGYLHVGWRQGATWRQGLDSNDWIPDSTTPGFHTPAEFFDKVVHLARLQPGGINGGIILMHLGTERKQPAMQVHTVLGVLIDSLRSEGYRFVPVTELVAASGIDLASLEQKKPLP